MSHVSVKRLIPPKNAKKPILVLLHSISPKIPQICSTSSFHLNFFTFHFYINGQIILTNLANAICNSYKAFIPCIHQKNIWCSQVTVGLLCLPFHVVSLTDDVLALPCFHVRLHVFFFSCVLRHFAKNWENSFSGYMKKKWGLTLKCKHG